MQRILDVALCYLNKSHETDGKVKHLAKFAPHSICI